MKKITILVCAIIMVAFSSQKVKAQAFEEGVKVISVGYGFPNLVGSLFNIYESNTGYSAHSLGPIYLKGEYAISDHLGIGLVIGYSSTTVEYTHEGFNDQFETVTYTDKIKYSSSNYLARLNWHFGDSDNFDPYAGFGIGYRASSSEYSSSDPDVTTTDLSLPFPFGFETTVGCRYFFTDNIGAYAELGFAKSPFQIGLSFKF